MSKPTFPNIGSECQNFGKLWANSDNLGKIQPLISFQPRVILYQNDGYNLRSKCNISNNLGPFEFKRNYWISWRKMAQIWHFLHLSVNIFLSITVRRLLITGACRGGSDENFDVFVTSSFQINKKWPRFLRYIKIHKIR